MTIPPAAVIALRRLIIKMRWHSQCATPEEIRSWADQLDALVARVEPQDTRHRIDNFETGHCARCGESGLFGVGQDTICYGPARVEPQEDIMPTPLEVNRILARDATARVEPPPQEQDCGLSANDIYHVMLAWEKEPASEEQTRIVTGLGKLRDQFIRRGDSPYVTEALATPHSPPTQEPT